MSKRIIFLGSSVTFGSASGGVSFADIICEKNGYEMIKEAVSGTTLVDSDDQSYVSRLRNIDCDSADLFICQLYALVEAPEYADTIRKSLSLPCRKINHPVMTFISKKEYEALLGACNGQSIIRSRDKLMIMVLYNTGCRVSELVNIRVCDITFANDKSETPYIHFYGKGRKERTTPIWRSTEAYIRQYVTLLEMPKTAYLLKGKRGDRITRSGIAQRITNISMAALETCPSLKEKTVTPHTFRHSAAMNLLQAGVDISTIAIWLGHESIETTHKYMVADLEIKRKAMEKLAETTDGAFNYKPSKSILAFLNSL